MGGGLLCDAWRLLCPPDATTDVNSAAAPAALTAKASSNDCILSIALPQAKQNVEVLKQAEVIRNVQNILQVGGGRGLGGDLWG